MKSFRMLLLVLAPLRTAAFSTSFLPLHCRVSSPSPSFTLNNGKIGTGSSLQMASGLVGRSEEGGENAFQAFVSLFQREIVDPFKPKSWDVVIDPDYKLAWIFGMAALAIYLFHPADKSCYDATVAQMCRPHFLAGLSSFAHLWFGLFLADRAARVRCVFDNDSFSMKDVYDENLEEQNVMKIRTKNYVVGGVDGWKYEHIINYEFFPSVDLPVLVYFKENQTPPNKWTVGPGKYDRVGGGMVHFFPAFGNAYQLKEQFEARGCRKVKE